MPTEHNPPPAPVGRDTPAFHEVVLIVYDRFQLLDLADPADVFRAATLLGARPGYRLTTASTHGTPVRSESGVAIAPDTSLSAIRKVDTLLVTGGLGVNDLIGDAQALRALRRLSRRAARTTSVCTGAVALAAAGLLDGYEATTHWASCDRLAQDHPAVEVRPDRIYVHDRDRWTSAGVTAAIDLALALVEHDHDARLAHHVAGWLVVFSRRPGGQTQFSAALRAQPARTPAIVELQRWLPDHLAEDLTVEALASRAAMSPRNFARAFHREVGITPAFLVEALRMEAARSLLETTDLTVAAVAARVGLSSGETLHRAFQRRFNTTPDRYRQHFQRRAS